MSALADLGLGLLSHLLTTGAGGFVGYLFAKRQTEHEVGYGRRVEAVERLQFLVVSIGEEFEAALARERPNEGSGAVSDGSSTEKLAWLVEDLERYRLRQAIWLDLDTFARLEALSDDLHERLRDLESLPSLRAAERKSVLAGLEAWLGAELPRTQEGLAESFRAALGVERWRRGNASWLGDRRNAPPR